MSYWIYENWRAHGHHAMIHRAECGHCNDGSGQRGGTRPDNGKWLSMDDMTPMTPGRVAAYLGVELIDDGAARSIANDWQGAALQRC